MIKFFNTNANINTIKKISSPVVSANVVSKTAQRIKIGKQSYLDLVTMPAAKQQDGSNILYYEYSHDGKQQALIAVSDSKEFRSAYYCDYNGRPITSCPIIQKNIEVLGVRLENVKDNYEKIKRVKLTATLYSSSSNYDRSSAHKMIQKMQEEQRQLMAQQQQVLPAKKSILNKLFGGR